MTKIEIRKCPMYRVTCMGKLCAFTTWRIVSDTFPTVTEWICDISDRVVERV